MESTLFVGLDAHKNSIGTTVVDQEGNQLDPTRLGSGDTELQEYLDGLSGRIEVVVEACSVWPHVYDTAVSAGAKVTLAHPYKVRVIREPA